VSVVEIPVQLPRGWWRAGDHHRTVGLRPLAGEDELMLIELGEALSPPARATALLARCVSGLAGAEPERTEAVRQLCVGDREALLLHARLLAFGERLSSVLTCPDAACGARMEIDIAVSDLLLSPYEAPRPSYEATPRHDGETWRVRFRVATGADQEAVASIAARDPAAGARLLLDRCVEEVRQPDGGMCKRVPPALEPPLAALLAERDPQAELTLAAPCPSCGREVSVLLDAGAWLFAELAGRLGRITHDVHVLARHYHWSETEILRLPGRRRERYVEALAAAAPRPGP
jgi:hypothetical protein